MGSQMVGISVLVLLLGPGAGVAQEHGRSDNVPPADTIWFEAPALFPMTVEVPEEFDPSRAYPAVVALHGFGSSATSFGRIAPVLTDAGFIGIIPRAPYVHQRSSETEQYSWGLNLWTPPPLTDDPEVDLRSTQLTAFSFIPRAVEAVSREYELGNVYVLGFSQGAVYAFGAGFYNPELFSGIVVFGLAGFSRDWATMRGGVLEDGNHLPVFIGLGDADPMVPYEDAERMRDLLQESGYDVTLAGFSGGHALPREQLLRVMEWLVEIEGRR
jgi:phospholipase/carboxylesterase